MRENTCRVEMKVFVLMQGLVERNRVSFLSNFKVGNGLAAIIIKDVVKGDKVLLQSDEIVQLRDFLNSIP